MKARARALAHGQASGGAAVAAELRRAHPARCRPVRGRCRPGDPKPSGALTTVVCLQRSGPHRLGSVHETAALRDAPRFLLTAARHWERGRVLEPWSERRAAESFHELGTPVTGLEAAQVRQEAAGKRPCRLRGVAQALLQAPLASGAATARCAFAKGEPTFGQAGPDHSAGRGGRLAPVCRTPVCTRALL